MALLESKVAARAALLFMVITTSMVLNLSPSTFVQAIGVQGMSTIIHIAFMDIGLLILTKVFFLLLILQWFATTCQCALLAIASSTVYRWGIRSLPPGIIARRVQLSVAAQLM